MQILFTKLSEKAQIPQQATTSDAWYDLCSTETYTLKTWERKLFKTNISLAIPHGYYGRVAPRSWLAYKFGLDVLAWVIDSWYRWELGVIVINFWDDEYIINEWDKIAQLIIEKCHEIERTETDILPEADRGEWWFWSTGK